MQPERYPWVVSQVLLDIRSAIVNQYAYVRQNKIDGYEDSSMRFNDINLKDIETSIDNIIEQEDSGDIVDILTAALQSIEEVEK